MPRWLSTALVLSFLTCSTALAEDGSAPWTSPVDDPSRFQLRDIFELEWADDPRISPDGQRVVYERSFMDIQNDRRRSNLWLIEVPRQDSDEPVHRPLTTGLANHGSPRWSPDGTRIAYVARGDQDEAGAQVHVRWLDGGQTARLTQLPSSPRGLSWSPDGRYLAFTSFVETKPKPMAALPDKPDGARWADPAIVIDELVYRADGAGYLPDGHSHLFVLSAEGGTARQVTSGDYDVDSSPVWTPDGSALIFASNRKEGWRHDPVDGEVASFGDDGALGPPEVLADDLDRSISSPTWSADGEGLYFDYSDRGNGKVGWVSASGGEVKVVAENLGGTSLGRPYSSGSFTVARNGTAALGNTVALNVTRPDHPADVAVVKGGFEDGRIHRLTRLNDDLFGHKELGVVEEMWVESSHDGRRIQGWIIKPPGFEAGVAAGKKYPLVLEIHGGPFADYGDRFTGELQLYASHGYVVLYMNPRGSSSYGREFGNLIHHAYPSHDYDDLMTGVDEVIARGYVDRSRLYVTGGSGGGVLTAWIVGHTDRFRAAVVAKPVINWTSFVLTADAAPFFWKYWFPGFPWDEPDNYFERSPLSYVGNVTTPTMLITGEADYRTPISESEQFYQALQLRQIDSALVRIPGASHGIANRPSQFMSKAAHVLAWFARYP